MDQWQGRLELRRESIPPFFITDPCNGDFSRNHSWKSVPFREVPMTPKERQRIYNPLAFTANLALSAAEITGPRIGNPQEFELEMSEL